MKAATPTCAPLDSARFRVNLWGTGTDKTKGRRNVHVAGLCDKAEDAVVLLVKWPQVRRFHTVRGSEFAGERLLRDLGQIAEAIPTRLSSAPSAPGPRRERLTHKKSTLRTTPSPATARYTHWTVLSVVAFFPLKK